MLSLRSVAVLALLSVAVAQTALEIDGRDIGEARIDLVPGASYAPLDRIAVGLGARLALPLGGDTAALRLAGHVLTIAVVEQGEDPARSGALKLNGRPVGDLAAIRGDDAIWGPVAGIVRAFGADVSLLSELDRVVVVTRRATVHGAELGSQGQIETLRLRVSAPVAIDRFDDPAIGRTELLLRRARLARAESLAGERMRRVDLVPEEGGVRVRIDAPGSEIEVIALVDGSGTDLRIRALPAGPSVAATADDRPSLVIVVGRPGDAPEASATLAGFTERMAAELRRSGVEVEVMSASVAALAPGRRLRAAAESDLFVALQAAELPPGEIRLWVLGEAAEASILETIVRRNAAEALVRATDAADETDALRRELLLGLVPDLAVGRRAAEALATALFQLGGYRAGSVGEAPLTALAPAAGRGVLIEIGAVDLATDELARALATALGSVAAGAR